MSAPNLQFFKNLSIGKKISLGLTPIITLLLSMKMALLGLVILIFLDLLTGIAKSLHRKKISFNPFKPRFFKTIKSYLLRKTWRKTYEYGIGIVVIVIFESLVFSGDASINFLERDFSLSELSVVIPAFIEVWSIFENVEAISKNNILKKLSTLLPRKVQDWFKEREIKKVPVEDIPRAVEKIIEKEISDRNEDIN